MTSTASLDDTFGAMLTGSLLTMSIYGITTLQAYFYYMTYPKDRLGLKILVAFTWVLDTIHVVFMCHAIHHYLIIGFVTPSVLAEGVWSLFVRGLLSFSTLSWRSWYNVSSPNEYTNVGVLLVLFEWSFIFAVCPTQYRWYVTGAIGTMVLAHFALGLETVAQFFMIRSFARLKEANYIAVLPFGITAILSDIFIAVALCALLESNRSDYEDTNYLISTLIGYAITRCLLTSLVAVVEIAVFVAKPDSLYSFAIDFVIGKLWANSLLASLNSRRGLRDRSKASSSSEATSTSFRVATRTEQSTGVDPGVISLVRIHRGDTETDHTEDLASDYNARSKNSSENPV